MMPQMTMVVKYKDAPKEGAKNWKISDGKNRLLVDSKLESQFEVGSTYEIDYRDITVKGNPFKVVEKATAKETIVADFVAKAGNGRGEVDIRSLLGTGHMYPNGVPSKAKILKDLWELHDAIDAFNRGIRVVDRGPSESTKQQEANYAYAENEDPGFGEFED